jgi:hypothetical protein
VLKKALSNYSKHQVILHYFKYHRILFGKKEQFMKQITMTRRFARKQISRLRRIVRAAHQDIFGPMDFSFEFSEEDLN